MKIALLGYGKMGKEIEKIALERNHQIIVKIDNTEDWEKNQEIINDADVAIEFSTPQSAVGNILKCFEKDIPVVVGTTAWQEHFDEINRIIKEKNQSLFYASNFSIGVNILFEINRRLAQLMNPYSEYEVKINETHHIHKQDAPSGTAITIANDIIDNLDRTEQYHKQFDLLVCDVNS